MTNPYTPPKGHYPSTPDRYVVPLLAIGLALCLCALAGTLHSFEAFRADCVVSQ